MSKISIRFFNDREVRAIWDEANSKWWLKKKLNADGVQLVSVTHDFKFEAPTERNELLMLLTMNVWKSSLSTIRTIEQTHSSTGSHTATTQ